MYGEDSRDLRGDVYGCSITTWKEWRDRVKQDLEYIMRCRSRLNDLYYEFSHVEELKKYGLDRGYAQWADQFMEPLNHINHGVYRLLELGDSLN